MSGARLLVLTVALLATPGWAQQAQPPATATQPAQLEGRVVRAGGGEPLRKAVVTLRRAGGRQAQAEGPLAEFVRQAGRGQALVTETDEAGRFRFENVPAASYRVVVQRNGYVNAEYGQRGPGRPGTPLAVRPGQKLNDLLFRLIPASAVTGRVFDADGEPFPYVQVRLLRQRYVRGRRQLLAAGAGMTNDLGEYRIFGLAPGEYYLLAAPPRFRRPLAPADTEEAFAPVYYPGTTDPAQAAQVRIGEGEEVRGMDLRVAAVPAVRVSGQVFNSVTGQPARGVSLRLIPRDSPLAGFTAGYRTGVRGDDGTFEFPAVAPGSYTLRGTLVGQQGGPLARLAAAEAAFGGGGQGGSYIGRLPLEVGATEVNDVRLVISPGAAVSGRVRVEGREDYAWSGARVTLTPTEDLFTPNRNAQLAEDGAFNLENVPPDIYQISLDRLPAGFYLKAARLAGREVLDTGVDLTAGVSAALELVVSRAGATVEGLLTDDDLLPVAGATVALVPPPDRRHLQRLFRSVTSDAQGRFSFTGVPPGEYKLLAFDDIEPGAWQDPEVLALYEAQAVSVRVAESDRQTVELKLLRSATAP